LDYASKNTFTVEVAIFIVVFVVFVVFLA